MLRIAGFFCNPCRGLLISASLATFRLVCACFPGYSTYVQLSILAANGIAHFDLFSAPAEPFCRLYGESGVHHTLGLSHFNSEATEPHGSKFQAAFQNFPPRKRTTLPPWGRHRKYDMSDMNQWCCQEGVRAPQEIETTR